MSSAPTLIPCLETQRLHLRGHRLDDLGDCAAMWGDANVTRYVGGTPVSAEDVWSKLLRYVGHWSLMGFGYWVIEEKASGRFAGEIGFAHFKRHMMPSLEGMPEIGWALPTWAHGRGFATEAARAVVAWGDAHFGPRPTACMIHPDNVPSIRVAEKCGYRQTEQTTYKGDPVLLFRRTR
jgi:RimJ/RimL family protein N-acetyltransferase